MDASDIGRTPGQFFWPDGTNVNSLFSSFWFGSNPNEFGVGKETCVFLSCDYTKFFDSPCDWNKTFVCELAAKDLPCF